MQIKQSVFNVYIVINMASEKKNYWYEWLKVLG